MTTRFRNSFTHRQGLDDAQVVSGRIVNINLVNWTVDVRSQFDRHFYFGIQIGSPYCHFNRGEGIYVFPEVGARCMVTLPSDSSPPFVSSFLMPHEMVVGGSDDAPLGTESHGAPAQFATAASFAGGRSRPKPGDIVCKTRDGNFLILHRGGVLQIGATELSQRIFIPLRNYMMDVSENYAHHNAGGSMLWGIQEGPSQNLPSEFTQTFRIFANDKFADIRLTAGKVHAPMPEPSGDAGETTNLEKLGIGTDKNNPIIYEVVVAPKGFNTQNGEPENDNTRKAVVMRYFFDRKGGAFLRSQGSMLISVKKQFMLHVTEQITLQGEKNALIKMKKGIDIDGGDYSHIKGGVVRLGPGVTPVARQGDIVTFTLPPANFDGTIAGSPAKGLVTFIGAAYGTILTGSSVVRA